ncbi:MAG: hypothetical protein PHQ58_07700 [Rhodoferax sp.]|uniref:hypothetical protein n=1 Tax=Rhodoferax sp. TaxID=50421 RepID=UPI002627DE67|nr:hypothetical protein [Rhodoferax sp.]MDD2880307.1 hypothetical protein [Rhodoferax sp.]
MPNEQNPTIEIRVCWNGLERRNPNDKPVEYGSWHPDSPDRREKLRVIVESGNAANGAGSHWIDARETSSTTK